MSLNVARTGTVVLSKGSMFDTNWVPTPGKTWPSGTSSMKFYSSTGAVIAELLGTVTPQLISYLIPPDQHEIIPAGAQYELFLMTDAEDPYMIEHGTVIRREAQFWTPPPTSLQGESRLFTDDMTNPGISRRWIAVQGSSAMHDLSLGGYPGQYGMGPAIGLAFWQCANRYIQPFGGDSWRIKFRVYSTRLAVGDGGTGKMRCHGACDTFFNTGIALELETGISNNFLHICKVIGPSEVTYIDTLSSITSTNDNFTMQFTDIENRLDIFKNN